METIKGGGETVVLPQSLKVLAPIGLMTTSTKILLYPDWEKRAISRVTGAEDLKDAAGISIAALQSEGGGVCRHMKMRPIFSRTSTRLGFIMIALPRLTVVPLDRQNFSLRRRLAKTTSLNGIILGQNHTITFQSRMHRPIKL